MSLAVKAKIIGMPKLLQKLKVIPDVARAEIRIEMARQADEIVAMMKSLVPKDSHALEKSIGWTWGGKVPKGAMAIATGGKGDLTITIYAGNDEAWYARFVEFGTRAHTAGGKFAGAEIPAIPAQPFFYPAFRASKKGAKRRLRSAARKAAQKVAAQ